MHFLFPNMQISQSLLPSGKKDMKKKSENLSPLLPNHLQLEPETTIITATLRPHTRTATHAVHTSPATDGVSLTDVLTVQDGHNDNHIEFHLNKMIKKRTTIETTELQNEV